MEKIKQRKGALIFGILLIIQCAYMIFWGTQKSGYYVDEFFTYDKAHYISESTPNREKLYDAEFLEYEKWYDVPEIKNTLMVKREEALMQDSFLYNVYAFTQKWPYMALLNYVEAIFFEGKLSWWSAISLNIVLFALNQVVLFLLAKRVCKDQTMALLAGVMYGFCGMAASMVVYVRFYMYVTFLMTLFAYIHVLMWEGEKHWKNIILEIVSLPILYIAYRTSPLAGIYGIAIIGCFSLGLLLSRKWKQALYYILPIGVGGILYLALKTNYLEILMNPHKAIASDSMNVATQSLINGLLTLNLNEIINRSNIFMQIVNRYLFGHVVILILYIILFVGIVICLVKNKEKREYKGSSFLGILFGSVLVYAIMSICFDLSTTRYNSFIFPAVALCCIGVINCLLDKNKNKVVLIITGLLIGEVLFTVRVPRVENLYLDDREGVIAIQQHKGINSVVVDYHWDDDVMYECLAYTDEDKKVMFTAYGDTDYDKLGDTVLVWRSANKDERVIQDLLDAGYTYIDEIAQTHVSVVYLCKR